MECGIEWDEWMMVQEFITPRSTVLELGARFGTTSCALAAATNNSGSVVSVEPDARMWRFIQKNRAIQQCSFALMRGSISQGSLVLAPRGYDTRTRAARANETRGVVPHLSFRALEELTGYRFNTLLIDCEGCIGSLLTEEDASDVLSGIDVVLMEHDLPNELEHGYGHYFDLFRRHGLHQVWLSVDSFDPHGAWSRILRHSAWRRLADRSELATARRACWDAARRHNRTREQLRCLDPRHDDPARQLNASMHATLTDRQLEVVLNRLALTAPADHDRHVEQKQSQKATAASHVETHRARP